MANVAPRRKASGVARRARSPEHVARSEATGAACIGGCWKGARRKGRRAKFVVLFGAEVSRRRALGRERQAEVACWSAPAGRRLYEPTEFAVPRSPSVDGRSGAHLVFQDSHSSSLLSLQPSSIFSPIFFPFYIRSVSVRP